MKFKFVAAIVMALGLSAVAHADQKVAEYGDPVLGNSYGGCTFTQVYSTGGGYYLYNEYNITCTSGTYVVGVYTDTQRNQTHTRHIIKNPTHRNNPAGGIYI